MRMCMVFVEVRFIPRAGRMSSGESARIEDILGLAVPSTQ